MCTYIIIILIVVQLEAFEWYFVKNIIMVVVFQFLKNKVNQPISDSRGFFNL